MLKNHEPPKPLTLVPRYTKAPLLRVHQESDDSLSIQDAEAVSQFLCKAPQEIIIKFLLTTSRVSKTKTLENGGYVIEREKGPLGIHTLVSSKEAKKFVGLALNRVSREERTDLLNKKDRYGVTPLKMMTDPSKPWGKPILKKLNIPVP